MAFISDLYARRMRLDILHALPIVLAFGCGAAAADEETALRGPHAATTPERTEVDIPVSELPAAVLAALAGKGEIREAEKIVTARGIAYEVEAGTLEYLLDERGTILAQHEDDDADSDSDDDEEGDDD